MAHREILVAEIVSEPYVDDQITTMGENKNIAPTVVKVIDLDTAEVALLVCNTIILSAFKRAGGTLSGRFFKFTGGSIREGKRYRDIQVAEMEAISE